ncbi:GAP1-N1 domain-containing protein [Massilia sp. GCM10023247]|uniref:GAP1-N1 domain-containing protein n=1 Tax=Massilia sp. GCM10023247 TaxID=3252643 RepID=UPI003621E6FD
MIVDQAVFGEVNGGHGLVAASGERTLAIALASRMDLPDTSPPGADWSPFVSGFSYRDKYVISRTFRDPRATRAGMVLTHALILPLDLVTETDDLRTVFSALITKSEAPSGISAITIEPPDGSDFPAVPELTLIASALVSRTAQGPVIRPGHEGFDLLIASLWRNLTPEMRRGFSFRLSFGPGDLVEEPRPTLVCTPRSLIGRWQGYRLSEHFANSAVTTAAKMLSGERGGLLLREYAEQIGAEIANIADLSLLEQAYRFAVLEPGPIGHTLTAIRLTERLSKNSVVGVLGKRRLLDHFILQLETASPSDILQLRNLELSAFAQDDAVWAAVRLRVSLLPLTASSDSQFVELVGSSLSETNASEKWRHQVLSGLVDSAGQNKKEFATAMWRWASIAPALVHPLWEHLAVNKVFEPFLVDACPDHLDQNAGPVVMTYALKHSLYKLHGATVASLFPALEAVKLQVQKEPSFSNDGVALALRKAQVHEIITIAVEVDDDRVTAVAGDTVAKKPQLLAKFEMTGKVIRAIWAIALDKNIDSWRGPSSPREAFNRVLDDFLDGIPIPPGLIAHLSRTSVGELSTFARRPELWSALGNPTRDCLLKKTASAWFSTFEAGVSQYNVERELCDAILADHKLESFLRKSAETSVGDATRLAASLSTFPEKRFLQWWHEASNHIRAIPPAEAEALGQLVADRGWQHVADDLMRLLRSFRHDVRPALRACIRLVGFSDRFWYGLSEVTPQEKWNAFEDLAAELYPAGPEQDAIWERAGGKDADLSWGGNGRYRWHDALSRTRRGKLPSASNLLREMLIDYPANPKLNSLAADAEFNA